MTGYLACDYSFARPAPPAIAAAGYTAVLRYLSEDPAKDLLAAEAAGLHAAGLGIGLIWETTAGRALAGEGAGLIDAAVAAGELRSLGVPAGTPVFANVGDWAVAAAEVGAIRGYYYGWRHGLAEYQPGAGGYGCAYILGQLAEGGAVGIWWQNAIDAEGVPGSIVSPHASIYQRTTPTRSIAGTPAGQWDEDACGFGPVPEPPWWRPAPAPAPEPPAPAVPALVAVDLVYSDGTTRRLPVS